jgi:hypothetical protein
MKILLVEGTVKGTGERSRHIEVSTRTFRTIDGHPRGLLMELAALSSIKHIPLRMKGYSTASGRRSGKDDSANDESRTPPSSTDHSE